MLAIITWVCPTLGAPNWSKAPKSVVASKALVHFEQLTEPSTREKDATRRLKDTWSPRSRALIYYVRGLARYRQGKFGAAAEDLDRARPHIVNRDHALFFEAESRFHTGQYGPALKVYRRLIRTEPLSNWRPRAEFRLADCWIGLGQFRRAARHLEKLVKTYPDYPHPVAIRLAIGQAYQRGKHLQKAASWYQDALFRFPDDPLLESVHIGLETLKESGVEPPVLSVEELLSLGSELRRRKHFSAAHSRLGALLKRPDISPELRWKAQFQVARAFLQEERFEEALSLFRQLGKSQRAAVLNRRAQRWSAYTLEQMGRGIQAEKAFRSSLRNPQNPAPDSQQRVWRLTFDCGLYERAAVLMDELADRSRRWFRRTRFTRAWQSYRAGEYTRAIDQFKAMAKTARKPAKLLYWQARSHSNLGYREEAKALYREITGRFPESYYGLQSQARLQELTGGTANSLRIKTEPFQHRPLNVLQVLLDPWSLGDFLFPSFLTAAIRRTGDAAAPVLAQVYLRPLAVDYGKAFPALLEAHEFSVIGEYTMAKLALRRVSDELRGFKKASRRQKNRWRFSRTPYVDNRKGSVRGAWGIAGVRKEKRSSRRKIRLLKTGLSTHENRLLSMAFVSLDDFYYGRRHARRPKHDEMGRESYDRLRKRWRYPRSFRSIVERSAQRFSVEPELVWAFITVESAHNPLAISRAGARGLLQVMPHTGELSARAMGLHNFGVSQLYEPQVAIEMAAWYMSQLITKFKGQKPLAMAGYNAGPHRVALWLRRKGNLPMDEFIEEIPYDEAREYGKKVLRYLMIYRGLYGNGQTDWVAQTIDSDYADNINF